MQTAVPMARCEGRAMRRHCGSEALNVVVRARENDVDIERNARRPMQNRRHSTDQG